MNGQEVIRLENLPAAPLEAAATFYDWLTSFREQLTGIEALVLVFAPADHSHDTWRLAAIQELAREAAPGRVNGIVGSDREAIREVMEYLSLAHGITGQILTVDGTVDGKSGGKA